MRIEIYRKISELVSLQGACEKEGRRPVEADLSILPKAAMVVEGQRILWVGPDSKLPTLQKLKEFSRAGAAKIDKGARRTQSSRTAKKSKATNPAIQETNLQGLSVLPGFVECHTHTVFAGDRANEFEMRNQGATYQEIAAAGGGIRSTVKATRNASPAELRRLAQARVDRFLDQGVTALEIKSGYGLDLTNELKCLTVAKSLKGPRVFLTYLGPHAIPAEHKNSATYLEEVIRRHLPALKKRKITGRVDIFVETGFFSIKDATAYLAKAKELGFELTIHADQITRTGASEFGVASGARSVDHVIQISDQDVQTLAKSQTTAVLLPTADLYLRCAYPPARKLIDAGARVAIATDFNPGTAPSQELSLVGLLARLEMKMSLPEVLSAYTVGAAYALGLEEDCGSLQVGKRADFLAIDGSWRNLFYQIGHHPVRKVWVGGQILKDS